VDSERRRELKRIYKAKEKAAARAAMLLDEVRLDELLEHLDEQLPEQGCNRTLRLTRAWAVEHRIDANALETSLAHFGGYCDCEVLANVEPEAIF
jgi:hypothetical protein